MLGDQTPASKQPSLLVSGLKGLIPFRGSRKLFPKDPLARVFMESSMFVVKTVDSADERNQCFQLRHRVMCYEFGKNSTTPEGLDQDRFDQWADMLIIKDKQSRQVVGTYRLLCSLRAPAFYSSSEFALGELFAEQGVKVELSRACIAKEYRKGTVIALLWRGIYDYMTQVNADYLFGCCSVENIGYPKVLEMIRYLSEKGHLEHKYNAPPLPAYDPSAQLIKSWAETQEEEKTQTRSLPPLMRAYLNAGAKLLAVPAFDPEFNCFDFLTMMSLKNLNQTHVKKLSKTR